MRYLGIPLGLAGATLPTDISEYLDIYKVALPGITSKTIWEYLATANYAVTILATSIPGNLDILSRWLPVACRWDLATANNGSVPILGLKLTGPTCCPGNS